jgi:site-specific recombinase XerD
VRLEELAALDVDDLAISARKGWEVVRSGKRDAYREVALNAEAREALDGWISERRARFDGRDQKRLEYGGFIMTIPSGSGTLQLVWSIAITRTRPTGFSDRAGPHAPSGPCFSCLIHPSAWNKNSAKFAPNS